MRALLRKFGTGTVAIVVVAVAAGAIAGASIPGPDGVVHACYRQAGGLLQPPKGSVRIVDSGEGCRSGETRITWNQRGLAGPPGADGAPGLQGPEGPQGPAGPSTPPASRLVHVSGPVPLPPTGPVTVASIDLTSGTWALVSNGVISANEPHLRNTATCVLRDAGDSEIGVARISGDPFTNIPFSIIGYASLPSGGTVNLVCDALVSLSGGEFSVLATAVTPI